MRTLVSPWNRTAQQDGQLTPEHTEQLVAAVEGGSQVCRTDDTDPAGQLTHLLRVVAFREPIDGQQQWAVVFDAPDGTEVVDTEDEAKARAHYTERVQELTSLGFLWTVTDVPGITTTPYTYTVSRRTRDGQWSVVSQRPGRFDASDCSTPQDAATTHCGEEHDPAAALNQDNALNAALAGRPCEALYTAVRVEVATDDGRTAEHTVELDLYEPTAEEVAAHRQVLVEDLNQLALSHADYDDVDNQY